MYDCPVGKATLVNLSFACVTTSQLSDIVLQTLTPHEVICHYLLIFVEHLWLYVKTVVTCCHHPDRLLVSLFSYP